MLTLRWALCIGFLLRVAVAIWNGFWGPSLDAGADALGFHESAVAQAANKEPWEWVGVGYIYSKTLGFLYTYITDALFFGSMLSVLMWVGSALLLIGIMRLLSVNKSDQVKAMLIFALLPTSITYTSVTLREAYQLCMVNLAVYSALKISMKKSLVHWIPLLASIPVMGVLHGALLAFGVLLVAGTLMLSAIGSRGIPLIKVALALPIAILIFKYGVEIFVDIAYGTVEFGLTTAIQTFQENSLVGDARANYKENPEVPSLVSLIYFIPAGLFQYLFEPMPWRVAGAADIGLLAENILRAWLIWKALVALRDMPAIGRNPALLVFISFVAIETLWSLGTVNWGTAARHHLPSIGLLVASAYACSRLMIKRNRTSQRLGTHRLPPSQSST